MNSTTNTVKRGHPAKETRAQRPKRIPMSGSRMRMEVPEEYKDPNYHYAWINDQGELIPRALRALYEHVKVSECPVWGTSDVDSASSSDSNVCMGVGHGVTAYLMKLPMEYYEEDQAAQRKINNDRTADLKRELNSGEDGTYGEVDIS